MQISVLRTWGDTNEISGASTVFYSNRLQACAIVNTVNALRRLTVAFIYGLNGVEPPHSRTPPPIGRPLRETTVASERRAGEGDIGNHDSNNNSNNNNDNDSSNNSIART